MQHPNLMSQQQSPNSWHKLALLHIDCYKKHYSWPSDIHCSNNDSIISCPFVRPFGKVDCTSRETRTLIAMLRGTPGCAVISNGFVMLDLMYPIRVSTCAASLVMADVWHSSCTGTVYFSWVVVMKCFIAAAYSPVMWQVRIHLIRAAFCLVMPAMAPFPVLSFMMVCSVPISEGIPLNMLAFNLTLNSPSK